MASGLGKFRRGGKDAVLVLFPTGHPWEVKGGILVHGNQKGTLWQPERTKAKHKHNFKSPQFMNTASLFPDAVPE